MKSFSYLEGIILLSIMSIVACIVFPFANHISQPRFEVEGYITEKMFTPAYRVYVMHHSDSWTVDIDIGIGIGSVNVTKKYYESASKGDCVQVEYSKGRFSNAIYIKQIIQDGKTSK